MYSVFIDGVRQPVAPSKINTKIKNQNKVISLLDGSELNLLKKPGLTDISFVLDYPALEYPYTKYDGGFKPPDYFTDKLEQLKLSEKPFKFSVSRVYGKKVLFKTNMYVSLEDYAIDEDATNGADLKVSISLKQYFDKSTKRVIITKVSADGTGEDTAEVKKGSDSRPSKPTPKSYTVKRGDTLWGICRKQLGNGNRYPEIAKLNKITNPNLIFPGQVIKFE